MANPEVIDCPVGVWTKVASNVLSVELAVKLTDPNTYLHTTRDFNDPAPTNENDALILPFDKPSLIWHPTEVDVYVMPKRINGKIRVVNKSPLEVGFVLTNDFNFVLNNSINFVLTNPQ